MKSLYQLGWAKLYCSNIESHTFSDWKQQSFISQLCLMFAVGHLGTLLCIVLTPGPWIKKLPETMKPEKSLVVLAQGKEQSKFYIWFLNLPHTSNTVLTFYWSCPFQRMEGSTSYHVHGRNAKTFMNRRSDYCSSLCFSPQIDFPLYSEVATLMSLVHIWNLFCIFTMKWALINNI